MNYCKKCNACTEQEICSNCNKKTIELPKDVDTPVLLISESGIEQERITAALKDSKIPFSLRTIKKESSIEVITGPAGAKKDILVPLASYEQAKDLLIGIGALKIDGAEIVEDSSAEYNFQAPDEEEMSTTKRRIVKVVSVILFFAIIWGVVAAVDAIAAFIMGLF